MRRLKHIIYTVFILALIGIILWRAYPELKEWLTESGKDSKNPTGTTVQLAYQLKEKKETNFPIDRGTKSLKFITNAEYYKTHEDSVNYAINIEILNSAGKILLKKIYHFKNYTELYKKRHSSRVLSNPFLIKGRCYITPNFTFILPIDNLKNPSLLKVKWVPLDNVKNVKSVMIRMSSQEQISALKKNIMWYRLSPDTKKSLASGNFYPANMLTTAEKQNILLHLWSPIGPTGNSGYDYKVRRIGRMPTSDLVHTTLLVHDDPKIDESDGFKTDMFKLYVDSGLDGFFKSQSNANIKKAKNLFIKLFNGSSASDLKSDWKKLGMNIVEFKRGKRIYTVVYEMKNKHFGRGFYIFCKSSIARNVALEMPHRFWDTHTGIIGYKLMLSGCFSGAAWNTVHRYQTPNDIASSSDAAHSKNSFFYSFTLAFSEVMPKYSILAQLHGFSNNKQKSYYGKKAAAILSNSTSKPSKHFLYYAKLIKKIFPSHTYIYPLTNIKWLAGIDNASGLVLRKADKNQIFIHMEMNDKTRLSMAKDYKQRKKFTHCIIDKTTKLYPAVGK